MREAALEEKQAISRARKQRMLKMEEDAKSKVIMSSNHRESATVLHFCLKTRLILSLSFNHGSSAGEKVGY